MPIDWGTIATAGAVQALSAPYWTKWQKWLRARRKILVLGASGAGKTQFVHSLIDPMSATIPSLTQRTVSVDRRKVTLDDYRFLLLDTPGQVLDKPKRRHAINEALHRGVEGVINIVCFGYHEAAEAGRAGAIPASGRNIARADYLERRRQVEIELLSEWVPLVDVKLTKWVLTVVTKADLWWPTRKRVSAYYESGDYSERLSVTPEVAVSVLPHCSVIEPFYGHKTSGRFGDHDRAGLQGHLRETLIRLTGAER